MKKVIKALFFLLIANVNAQQKDIPMFQKGDKIIFIGNSITQDGRYHNFFQIYNATRFPEDKIAYINAGIAGDVAEGMINRLEEDILSHKPTHAFLMTGMNDVSRYLYSKEKPSDKILKDRNTALNKYFKNTEQIIKSLIDNKIKPILITPSIYDQTGNQTVENNYGTNDGLETCAKHIKKMASEYNLLVVDFFDEMLAINTLEQLKDPSFTIVGPDRIHPQDIGHLVMAFQLIKNTSISKYISSVAINAKKREVLLAFKANVVIKELTNNLEFKVKEQSLPFPITQNLDKVNEIIPLDKTINNQILKIKKLKKGDYKLYIDTVLIDTFSSKELKKGINLAVYKQSPQNVQASKLAKKINFYHKTQDSLRNLAFIKYKKLSNYKGEKSLVSIKQFLLSENDKSKGKSWYEWDRKNILKYFEILPKKKEIKERLQLVRNQIYQENDPQWHNYKLIKE